MSILAVLLDSEPWQADALCAQTDPESFFPEKGGSTREAKKVCLSCEVRAECLQAALDRDERFGIWGGLSERERRAIQKGRAPMPVFEVAAPGPDIPTKAPTRVPIPRLAIVQPEKPAMPTPEPTPPSYVDQIVAVMSATEGHAHPDVRAARKVVANALVALNKTLRTVDGTAPVPTLAPTVKPDATRSRGAGAKDLKARIAALGVTAREIRSWAKHNGHDVPTAGMVPGWAVDAYEAAHTQQAAS